MFTLNCSGRLLVIDKPVVMGIINTTPDSFYANSRTAHTDAALRQAELMLQQGAAILDIGGQSTRPGSEQVGAATEAKRVQSIVKAIANTFPEAFLSIDTYHAIVAKQAVEAGVSIVNDISGGRFDEEMLPTVAALKVPYICMHSKGSPENMQDNPQYKNISLEVLDYFIERLAACRQAGIQDIIIDPGFGFAKTIAHNFELLQQLALLKVLQKPLLAGISRKSTIYKTLGTTADKALNGTTVLHTIALLNGAHILRVHDVQEAVEAITLVEAYKG